MRVRAWAWFGGIFGDPQPRSTLCNRRQTLLYLALAVLGFVLAFLRLPPVARGTLWTEDAGIFLEQAYRLPLGSALFHGYAGYAHLLPRAVAELTAQFFLLRDIPIATAVIMAFLLDALALGVFYLCASQLKTWIARLVLWVLVVAAPIAGMEIALSTANFQWYLLATAFFAVLARRTGVTATIVTSVIVGLAVGSSALALAFVYPLVLLRAVRFRTPGDLTVAALATVTAALQLAVILQGGRTPGGPIHITHIPLTYLIDVLGVGWAGPIPVRILDTHAPVLYLTFAVIALIVTLALAWWTRMTSKLAIVAAVFSLVSCGVIGILTGFVGPDAFWLQIGIGTRYFFFPVFLVGVVIVVAIDVLVRDPRRSARGLAVLIVAVQLVAAAINYRQDDVRITQFSKTTWAQEIHTAHRLCLGGAESVYLRGSTRSPNDYDTVIVPCRVVLGG